jgi:hypothetical protein
MNQPHPAQAGQSGHRIRDFLVLGKPPQRPKKRQVAQSSPPFGKREGAKDERESPTLERERKR